MKKKNFPKKLVLNKTTVAHLRNNEMKTVKGGFSGIPECRTCIDPCAWTGLSVCFCRPTDGCTSTDH